MTLDPEIAQRLMQQALKVAHVAGERIVEIYSQDYSVSYKTDETPVTQADLDANRIIVEALEQLPDQFPVLSEESDLVPFSERQDWSYFWLVDPLDGTREFIRRNGEFTVNIALVANGEPVLGVVVAPVLGVSYFATRGSGAWKQVGQSDPTPIHVRAAPVESSEFTVARSRCPHVGKRFQQFLDKLGSHQEIPMGAALKSCLVAEGLADVYLRIGPTGEWDTAAAQCIVEEAGGHITDTQLVDLRYNTRESLLNPNFVVFGDETLDWADFLSADVAS